MRGIARTIVSMTLIAGAVGALGGCGLPPAIALASYAIDGVSYVATGKSTTDHALSLATDRDCSMLRLVHEESVCRKSAKNIREEKEKRDAQMAAYAANSGEVAAGTIVLDGDAPVETLLAAWTPPDTPMIARLRDAEPVADDEIDELPEDVAPEAAPPAQIAQLRMPEPIIPKTPAKRWVLVLGSYTDELGASAAMRKFLAFRPEVVTTTVNGKRYLRVIAGPYDQGALVAAKARAREAGASDAWGAPLCVGSVADARCVVREASREMPTRPLPRQS